VFFEVCVSVESESREHILADEGPAGPTAFTINFPFVLVFVCPLQSVTSRVDS